MVNSRNPTRVKCPIYKMHVDTIALLQIDLDCDTVSEAEPNRTDEPTHLADQHQRTRIQFPGTEISLFNGHLKICFYITCYIKPATSNLVTSNQSDFFLHQTFNTTSSTLTLSTSNVLVSAFFSLTGIYVPSHERCNPLWAVVG